MNKKKILIVDDDVVSARILKTGLERSGDYEIRTEQRATNALLAARAFGPDMILLDVCMIDGDGGDVAFALRNDKQLQNVPIVFLTSIISENEAQNGNARRGPFPFLAKPARLERVIACIEKHCGAFDSGESAFYGKDGSMSAKRILVIDDDNQSTRMVKLSLERTGRYEVRELNDPLPALTVAREFKPDLILLDVCMPGAQGVDVAFQIRADAQFQQTPVVFMTSLVSEWEAIGDGTSDGGFHFVAKPARLPRIISCIEKSLDAAWQADEFSIQGKHP